MGWRISTLFFEEDTAFGDDDGAVAIDKVLAVIVGQGDGDVGVFDADIEGDTEDTLGFIWGESGNSRKEPFAPSSYL